MVKHNRLSRLPAIELSCRDVIKLSWCGLEIWVGGRAPINQSTLMPSSFCLQLEVNAWRCWLGGRPWWGESSHPGTQGAEQRGAEQRAYVS